jgi:hypothetical protein
MTTSKFNTETKSLAQQPKQPNPPHLLFNVILFISQVAYLWSVHYVGVENVEYIKHFFGLDFNTLMPVVDILMVNHEFFPKLLVNTYVDWLIKKFPKSNLCAYVVFSLVSFITCPTACFWTCCITVTEELILGYVFHQMLHDKHNGYKHCTGIYCKIVTYIKSLWS